MVEVNIEDLRALLFWATIGIATSKGGYQGNEIEHILESYAEAISFGLPNKPEFGSGEDRVSKGE